MNRFQLIIFLIFLAKVNSFLISDNYCDCRSTVDDEIEEQEKSKQNFPFIVSIGRLNDGSLDFTNKHKIKTHLCNGVILNDFLILTSASCVHPYEDQIENIGYGLNNRLNDLIAIFDDKRRPIEQIIIHPKFNSTTLDNDIAIIKAKDNLLLQDNMKVKPVCLLKTTAWFNRMLTNYWGKINATKEISSSDVKYFRYLKETNLEDISYNVDDCSNQPRYCMRSINNEVPDHSNETIICNVEDGTPLLFSEDSKTTSVGIFSYYSDEQKTDDNCPSVGVYTKINAFLDFIEEHANNKICYF